MAAVDIIAQRRQALESLKKSKKRVPDSVIDKWLLDNTPAELKLSANPGPQRTSRSGQRITSELSRVPGISFVVARLLASRTDRRQPRKALQESKAAFRRYTLRSRTSMDRRPAR